jgi:3-oxoadipate enol-lactonase
MPVIGVTAPADPPQVQTTTTPQTQQRRPSQERTSQTQTPAPADAPDSAQTQKLPPIEKHSGHLDVGGSKIYYEDCGSGASVVLLHDGLLHSITWDSVWEPLCRKYHAVRYDRRGYGRSDVPKKEFSPTDDLAALLTHLTIPHAVVVGNSSGAALAIDFALEHPEMVEGLFLIGPVIDGMDVSPSFIERGKKNNAPLANGDVKGAAENWSKDQYIIGEGHDPIRKKLYEGLIDNPQNLKYTGEFQARDSTPAVKRMGEIHIPTRILVGEFDISDVHAHAGAIEEGIAGSERDVIINAGHLVQLEQSEIVLDKLTAFVDLQERKTVEVPVEMLKSYAGAYDSKDGIINVAMNDGHLTAKLPGQPPFPLYAESASKFFLKFAEIDIEFTKDAAGKVKQALISQDGGTTKAPRMSTPPTKP